jgi:hypothetical protein
MSPAAAAARSLWLQEALDPAGERPPLHGNLRADVCIVGGGLTGLWTALALKEREPALDVVLLEGDVCGAGASGRNGGFVLSLWAKFQALERVCGAAEALRLARASAAAVTEIGAFCREHDIDAHLREEGWLWAATNRSQVGAWDDTVAAIERHGERPFIRLEPEEVARRAGSPAHLGGVFEPTAATVHPARLTRGLRRVALDRGVRIFERSLMSAQIRSESGRALVGAAHCTTSVPCWPCCQWPLTEQKKTYRPRRGLTTARVFLPGSIVFVPPKSFEPGRKQHMEPGTTRMLWGTGLGFVSSIATLPAGPGAGCRRRSSRPTGRRSASGPAPGAWPPASRWPRHRPNRRRTRRAPRRPGQSGDQAAGRTSLAWNRPSRPASSSRAAPRSHFSRPLGGAVETVISAIEWRVRALAPSPTNASTTALAERLGSNAQPSTTRASSRSSRARARLVTPRRANLAIAAGRSEGSASEAGRSTTIIATVSCSSRVRGPWRRR